MFLTPDELAELTGRSQKAEQADALRQMGLPFKITDNRIRLLVINVENWFWRREFVDIDAPEFMGYDESWARYLKDMRNGIPTTTFKRGDILPVMSCIYIMRDDGGVGYVGQTVNLASRIHYHTHKWWTTLQVIEAPDWWPYRFEKDWLCDTESAVIKRFKPPMNRAVVPGSCSVPGLPELLARLQP